MERIKSRNFVLVVCGVFFFIMFLFLVIVGILRIVDKVRESNVYNNIKLNSSRIEVSGEANFVENTPIVYQTNIEDINVRLKKKGDYARFIVEFCNLNEDDLIVDDIVSGNIVCNDGFNDISCDNVQINGYLKNDNKKFNSNQCVNFVVDVQCISDLEQETFVFISEYKIDLLKFNN